MNLQNKQENSRNSCRPRQRTVTKCLLAQLWWRRAQNRAQKQNKTTIKVCRYSMYWCMFEFGSVHVSVNVCAFLCLCQFLACEQTLLSSLYLKSFVSAFKSQHINLSLFVATAAAAASKTQYYKTWKLIILFKFITLKLSLWENQGDVESNKHCHSGLLLPYWAELPHTKVL